MLPNNKTVTFVKFKSFERKEMIPLTPQLYKFQCDYPKGLDAVLYKRRLNRGVVCCCLSNLVDRGRAIVKWQSWISLAFLKNWADDTGARRSVMAMSRDVIATSWVMMGEVRLCVIFCWLYESRLFLGSWTGMWMCSSLHFFTRSSVVPHRFE